MTERPHIFIVEDDAGVAEGLVSGLKRAGCGLALADTVLELDARVVRQNGEELGLTGYFANLDTTNDASRMTSVPRGICGSVSWLPEPPPVWGCVATSRCPPGRKMK